MGMKYGYFPVWYLRKKNRIWRLIFKVNILILCGLVLLISTVTWINLCEFDNDAGIVEATAIKYNEGDKIERVEVKTDKLYKRLKKLCDLLSEESIDIDSIEIDNKRINLGMKLPAQNDYTSVIKTLSKCYVIDGVSSSYDGGSVKKLFIRIRCDD